MKLNSSIAPAFSILGLLALASCGGGGGSSPPSAPTNPPAAGAPSVTRSVIMTASNPWDLAFAPDGTMFLTERCNGLSVRRSDGSVQRLMGTAGSALVAADFFCQGQSGMHGVAVDPQFATNRFVYVYMASNLGGAPSNRVVRLVVDGGYANVSGRVDIISDISFKASGNAWGGPGNHSGGRIRFHPSDGFLYVTTGDNHNGPLPQDVTQLGGKVLRVDRNGAAAPGNSTPNGGDARIYTYGHRNVQGIAFRPGTAQPFVCEHGPGHTDEVTPLTAGGNAGWDPQPQSGVTCADNYCGYTSNRPDGLQTRMTDLERFPSAIRPSWTNNGVSQGMGPCAFLSGSQWGAWDGRLAVGIMASQRLDLLQLDTAGIATAAETWTGIPAARVRALVNNPDGSLYAATDGGEIWRLAPQ